MEYSTGIHAVTARLYIMEELSDFVLREHLNTRELRN